MLSFFTMTLNHKLSNTTRFCVTLQFEKLNEQLVRTQRLGSKVSDLSVDRIQILVILE